MMSYTKHLGYLHIQSVLSSEPASVFKSVTTTLPVSIERQQRLDPIEAYDDNSVPQPFKPLSNAVEVNVQPVLYLAYLTRPFSEMGTKLNRELPHE